MLVRDTTIAGLLCWFTVPPGVGAMASVETITRTVVTTIATSQIDKDHV